MGRLRRVGGFSLIELMVTLTVAGILLGLAVPGFTSFIRSNRAQVQSSAFVNSLNFARAEAIRRSTPVLVTQQVAGNWQGGWNVYLDVNSDSSVDSGDTTLRISPSLTGAATLTSGTTALTFNRMGYASSITAPDTATFEYRLGADYCKLERDITINHLGRIIITQRSCP